MAKEWKKSGCNMCGIRCGLEILVEDNHILDVRPNVDGHGEDFPEVYCCRKGRSTKYFQENPNRLNYPLKKVNGEFVRISWDQAIQEIGQKLRKILDEHGPRSFAMATMGLAADQSEAGILISMLNAIGGQYAYSPIGIEFAGNWWSHGRVLGHQGMVTEADEDNIDIMIFWGSNAYVTHQVLDARTMIRRRSEHPDQTVIVVDPRMSETARMSDIHIHPKPGLDAIMIRGMVSLILDKGWQDQDYLDKYTVGFPEARKKWFDGFDYKAAFELCDVPYQQMEDFCHLLSHNVWGVHQDLGLFCGRHSTLNSYMLYQLMAVTGNLEVKGNKTMDSLTRFAQTAKDETTNPKMWRTVETDLFPVSDHYPPAVLADEIMSKKPEHLRAMFVSKANPARSYSDSDRVEEALDHLELLVAFDIAMTETARHADYVLPSMTGFEEYHWTIFQGNPKFISVRLKKPILEPIAERRPSQNAILEILRAAGYIPEMSEKVYAAAKRSYEERDIMIFMLAFGPWLASHPQWFNSMNLLIADALSRYMPGQSVAAALFRAICLISPLAFLGYCERAGFQPNKKYRWMLKTPMAPLAKMSMMDEVFWATYDNPNDQIIGYADPDPLKQMKKVIIHKDKKIHLFDETVDRFMKDLTIEKERAATSGTEEFPDVVSSGAHFDDGVNTLMRNNDTYQYRKPFKLFMNPEEAKKRGLADGEMVRITSKAGSVTAPVKYSFKMREGYCMLPHHSGLENEGQPVVGEPANRLMDHEHYDEITHNPIFRYVPCRIEKIEA